MAGRWNNVPAIFAFTDVYADAPLKATWNGDRDPRATYIEGNVTWVPPMTGGGLSGFRAFWSTDIHGHAQLSTVGTKNVAGFLDLDITCPPNPKNREYNLPWGAVDCPNNSPFAPKCLGKSCHKIVVFQQNHEFFITRAWHEAGGRYDNDEVAEIYFPNNGTIEPVMMDIKRGDSLVALWLPNVPNLADKGLGIQMRIEHATGEHRYIRWRSDMSTVGAGWTVKYVPDLKVIPILNGARIPAGATGITVHSVYSVPPSTGSGTNGPGISIRFSSLPAARG